jgi:hypothetical protein
MSSPLSDVLVRSATACLENALSGQRTSEYSLDRGGSRVVSHRHKRQYHPNDAHRGRLRVFGSIDGAYDWFYQLDWSPV